MKTKTTLIIAALAVILAVAFATWTETAEINVNAATGYIDLDFESVTNTACSDYMDCDYTGLAGSAPGNDGAPSVTLTLDNAYPGASATYEITAYNDGTIPVDIACTVTAPSELSVSISPSSVDNLDVESSVTLTVSILVGSVEEASTYEATISCTYQQW